MVSVNVNKTSEALAVSGGYVMIFGLVSFFFKEKLFLADTLIATLVGIIFGPISLDWFSPNSWTSDPDFLTLQIARVVIAIQVLFTGIALPKAYLRKEWMSLATLLGPIMTIAWFVCSLLVWGLIPGLTFLESLVIGACVTPTDPVLANAICKGRFAEKHVPLHVRNVIVAEAGANDGLGFPFLYIPLYLILIHEPSHPWHSVGGAVLEWFYNIVLFQVVLSCIIGAIIGYCARKVLRYCEEHNLIDHESFLSFGVALTFFTLGVVGIIGSDDILCCFVVGNSFTWNDWYRVETEDHAFQDVIDQLLNSAIFLYIGAILPWGQFGDVAFQLSPWRLVVLGILVMLVRRLPWVLALSHFIPALPTWREAGFAGFFGPIGVGALFYTQVSLEVLPKDGTRQHLRDVIYPVNLFLIFTSIVVHGITIPVAKSFERARTLTMQSTSKSLVSGTGGVSRLPPPMPLPSATMNNGTDSPAIRFDEAAMTGGKVSVSGAATQTTRQRSQPPTPILSRSSSPIRNASTDAEHLRPGMNRYTSESTTWIEGHERVTEDRDGSHVTVTRDDPAG